MESNDTFHVVTNAVLFQLVWLLAIFFDSGLAFFALVALLCHSIITYLKVSHVVPLVAIAIAGIALDSLMMLFGLYQFSDAMIGGLIVPAWLCILWFAFALTLLSSMRWTLAKPFLVVPLFALLAPLSYLAGRKFEALYFEDLTLLFIGISWAVVGMVAFYLLKPISLEFFKEDSVVSRDVGI